MTLENFQELQTIYFATLELIIHGQPKPTDPDGDCWRAAAHTVLGEFSTFIRTHDPRQTLTETLTDHFDRGAN